MSKPMGNLEAPLAERMRPRRLEDMVGQKHLLGPDCHLSRSLRKGRVFSVIFWGPPGSGKTTLARLIGEYTGLPFRSFSAVTSGVKELRQIIEEAKNFRKCSGKPTILFVDEIHRFNKAQQDAFLPHVESGEIILIGATTQNPSFEVIPPLISRSRVMMIHPLGKEEIKTLLLRALADRECGLGMLDIKIMPDAFEHMIGLSHGDARVALNNLEAAVSHALDGAQAMHVEVDLEIVEKALCRKALPYDKDGEEHYNVISAFHKSLRGSDVHASIYWLYRMLMAGEDPLFIGRRMIRFASEDIGLADPNALQVALVAFETWQKVGPPEAELALAQAAVYLASAPKSNALYLAEKSVRQEIERSGPQPVPLHIRNAPTALMKRLGHGRGYLYPHNYPDARVDQEYLPKDIKNRVFYQPTNRGFEQEIRKRACSDKKT
ncbi:MAG: replication-associated recombination protein A [Thermodesulfobacteriota bacterium]|nr:replication-associated recombination protein A [Thermodesulfobacteriota bacterium]